MTVTRNVISDLWPLYESGEASEDTRRLIEEFLRGNPDFARLLHESPEKALNGGTLPPLRREQELEVLRRTKRLVWVRDALFWIAVFLTATPFTVWDTSWGSGWLIRDLPWLACALAVGAAIVWCSYIAMKRRLSATGL
jgi:hypothetical protein